MDARHRRRSEADDMASVTTGHWGADTHERPDTHRRLWWKLHYDVRNHTWYAFGRVAFVRATDIDSATERGRRTIALLHPGFEVVRCDVTASTQTARMHFWRLVQFNRLWKENVKRGIPNTKAALWRKRDDRELEEIVVRATKDQDPARP